MSRSTKIRGVIALLALFAVAFVFESQADARRYRGRRVYRGPVVYGPVNYGNRVSVRAPFVGVDVNSFGGVRVRAPFVRVNTGW